jgi:hypothetical protein
MESLWDACTRVAMLVHNLTSTREFKPCSTHEMLLETNQALINNSGPLELLQQIGLKFYSHFHEWSNVADDSQNLFTRLSEFLYFFNGTVKPLLMSGEEYFSSLMSEWDVFDELNNQKPSTTPPFLSILTPAPAMPDALPPHGNVFP